MNDRGLLELGKDSAITWELEELKWVIGGLCSRIDSQELQAGTEEDFFRLSLIKEMHAWSEPPQSNINFSVVARPLEVFRALADAGRNYELRSISTLNGTCFKAIGDDDIALLKFCQDYGLPTDGVDFGDPLWLSKRMYPRPERLSYDSREIQTIGRVERGLRTTAAVAHWCQRLADLLDAKKWRELEKLTRQVGQDAYTFEPGPFHILMSQWRMRDGNIKVSLERGVLLTIVEVVGWYIKDALRVSVRPPTSEHSAARLVQATNGLRSYLWLHFLMSRQAQPIKRTVRRVCRDDGAYHGCGRTFDTDNPRARLCDECKRRKTQEKNARKYTARKERIDKKA